MNQPQAVISFFYDRTHPLVEPDVEPDDLVAALVDGVDLGLSIALVELAEGNVESHKQMAVRAFHAHDESTGDFHAGRAKYWAELRSEALTALGATIRAQSN